MISFVVGDARFVYRVAGVCIHDDHVLIHCFNGDESMWALPGGRVELLEASQGTLRREMREELGLEVTVERLLWVVENFFRWEDGRHAHELGLYYLMALPSDCPLLDTSRTFERVDEGLLIHFRWLPLAELDSVPLQPAFLRTRLRHLPPHVEHIVNMDELR
jgi:ADP-ribose pyrophosphatase YjhB (NUDIX family)